MMREVSEEFSSSSASYLLFSSPYCSFSWVCSLLSLTTNRVPLPFTALPVLPVFAPCFHSRQCLSNLSISACRAFLSSFLLSFSFSRALVYSLSSPISLSHSSCGLSRGLVLNWKVMMIYGWYNMQGEFVIKQELFVRVRTEPFEKIYQVHPKIIGSGSSAQVLRVRHRQRQQEGWRAAKAYPKSKPHSQQMMMNELNILRRLDHPAIVRVHEVFQNEHFTYVVQEYCEGGQLLARLQERGGFSQLEARRIWRQLLEAVGYCHAQRVCHRDLKPQNVLFLKKDSNEVKVIDFGSAFVWEADMRNELSLRGKNNVVGTAYYISPDILLENNHYDQRTDLWSLGVILYILIAGCFPFFGETEQDVMDEIGNYRYSLNVPALKTASNQVKDLIRKLLVPVDQRLTCEQIFAHPWMISQPNRTPVKVNTSGLAAYSKFSKTKRLAANFLASRATAAEVQQLTRLFQQMDINRDGELSFDELKRGLEKEGMKPADVKALMDRMDADHNGKVNYSQFIAGFAGEGQFSEEGIRRAFEMLDRDGNGSVSKQELLQLFEESELGTLGGRTVQQIMQECDKDGNGVIDYQQFRACLKGKP